ncbi:MAG: thiamine-monophosphate kinase [Phycisphaerales bacterium]
MKESDLLRHIYSRSAGLAARSIHIVVGPGDDCAVLRSASGDLQLITVDQLIEGRHFRAGTPIDRIARKIVARSVSDIAAMAGSPTWALATAALAADVSGEHASRLFDSIAKWAEHFGCPLVGGDIASLGSGGPPGTERIVVDGKDVDRGPRMVLTCTVAGTPHATRGPVLRSGARAGDEVWVTGRLGGSLESGRHMTFEPRVREGWWLAESLGESLRAMIDLSDGLGRDAGRIAAASGARIELFGPRLPVHEGVHSWDAALGDGEDYELCFVVAAGSASQRIPAACPHTGTALTRIGRVVEGSGCVLLDDDGKVLGDVSEVGWDHE